MFLPLLQAGRIRSVYVVLLILSHKLCCVNSRAAKAVSQDRLPTSSVTSARPLQSMSGTNLAATPTVLSITYWMVVQVKSASNRRSSTCRVWQRMALFCCDLDRSVLIRLPPCWVLLRDLRMLQHREPRVP